MRALVTGGGGFLGSGLVKALLERGDEVRILARGDYPELKALGAEMFRGDIREEETTARACEGMDVVFHTAALASGFGDPLVFEDINVHGTQKIIEGCKRAGVPHLVYTSTPSVVHTGHDIEGGDERLPYASHFDAHYPRTKARAERLVRAASDEKLATVSIRPHFIWGPGDRHLLPRLVDRARTGRLRRVGSGDPLTDTVYVDNCVHAHLLAADRLREGAPLGGNVYFVSDGDPVGLWTMAEKMLAAAGVGPIEGKVPYPVAWAAGALLELAHTLARSEKEPLMTRFGASQLAHAQWFDISAIRRDLGYEPKVGREEGLERLRQALQDSRGSVSAG